MKFERFARTFCRNVGTFGANLCKLFPNLRTRHSKVGQETSKFPGARMNRFDCKAGHTLGLSPAMGFMNENDSFVYFAILRELSSGLTLTMRFSTPSIFSKY